MITTPAGPEFMKNDGQSGARSGDHTHVVTYADILRDLEPLNEGRDDKDRISYDSLRVHAKRHYDLAATTAYWRARMHKELMKALGG